LTVVPIDNAGRSREGWQFGASPHQRVMISSPQAALAALAKEINDD
jgi:hypothetical protein